MFIGVHLWLKYSYIVRRFSSFLLFLLFLFASFSTLRAASVIDSDICVYGGSSGGVVAAVAAARLGKTVVLLSLNNHIGGMTASGLGVTDIGPGNNAAYIGGIA